MLQFPLFSGIVTFDVTSHPRMIEITIKAKFKYFQNHFIT